MFQYKYYLSPPEAGRAEEEAVVRAIRSNWIAPVGPDLDAFEVEFAEYVGGGHAVALSSGTAALHLALERHVRSGDTVAVSSFTFCGSVNPIIYLGGIPHFVDCEAQSWNLDPNLLESLLRDRQNGGRQIAAIVVVHLYGQTADMDSLLFLSDRYGVPIVEDAAEALGAFHRLGMAGAVAEAGIFSFNGNKIITTSGGGMLVTKDLQIAERVRKLSTQARDEEVYYQHSEVGFNYRLSNLLAAVGRVQLQDLPRRIQRRREVFEDYSVKLQGESVLFMPEPEWGTSNRWLTCLTLGSANPIKRDHCISSLRAQGIESRHLWKPMHQQPVYQHYPSTVSGVCDDIFDRGLCLPSGPDLTSQDISFITDCLRAHLSRL